MENSSVNQNDSTQTIKKSKWGKRLLFFCLILISSFFIYLFICGRTYSDGFRTGVAIKVSQKGIIFKTYEGELNLGGINQGDGTIMNKNIWIFSISKNDTATYNTIARNQGKQIRLHYKEVIKNFFWQGETPYFVDKVEIVH